MSVNKHKVLQNWVQTFIEAQYLHYQAAEGYADVRLIQPEYGDHVIKTDICGNQYKAYTFLFIGYQSIDTGTSDVNTDNMFMMDSFNDWLEEQQRIKNFPDFGEKCSEYEIIPLQNMAGITHITEDNIAQYMLGARIEYKEEQ